MQKPITTPLPADLPENWQLNNAVSPSGTDVGLTEKHGYNYLQKQVNNAQKAINTLNDTFTRVQDRTQDLATETEIVDDDILPYYDVSVSTAKKLTFANIVAKIHAKFSTIFATIATVNTKAPIASPTFTGEPKATTPAITDNSSRIATTAFINNLLNSAILVSRYFIPTVSRSETASSSTIVGNPLPTTWTSDTNKFVNGGYELSATSFNDSMVNCVDRSMSTSFSIGILSSAWVRIKLPTALKVTKMKVAVASSNEITQGTFVIQGSNNNSTWVAISDSINASAGTSNVSLKEVTVTPTESYQYYRVMISMPSNVSISVYEIQISEYVMEGFSNAFNLEGITPSFATNQRVLIETPTSTSSIGIISNTLNSKAIDAVLQGGKRYELVYNGTSFNAKEVL